MTITARNYAAQARKMVGATVNFLEGLKGDQRTKARTIELDFTREVAQKMDAAQHFALPDGALLFEDRLKGLKGQKLRLPFPAITLEWHEPVDGRCRDGSEWWPSKTVVIAFEADPDVMSYFCPGTERGILVFGAREHEGEWIPSTAFTAMPEDWEKPAMASEWATAGRTYAWGLTHYEGMVSKMGEAAASDALGRDMSTEVYAVLQFCEAMSCSNVGTEVIAGASTAVNARRIKDGKVPLLETKVLTVQVPGTTSIRIGASRKTGEIRQHLRRGHIRNLSDGRRIWVNSCVVGNPEKGRIEKAYRVLPEAARAVNAAGKPARVPAVP